MKLLLTGGHFSPALALIHKAKDDEIAVVGRKTVFEGDSGESLEYRLCKSLNIPFYPIRAGRFQRHWSRHIVASYGKLPLGFFDAQSVLKKYKPDVVVTFGGYLAVPVAYAAYFQKIPVVLHEQTMGAGLANRAIGKIAQKICISFDSSKQFFPEDRTILTGNPIREEIFDTSTPLHLPNGKPVLYVTGGSTGSHIINQLVYDSLSSLLEHFVIIHQTGDSQEYQDYDKLLALKSSFSSTLQDRHR